MSAYQTVIAAVDGFGWWYSLQLFRHGVSGDGKVAALYQGDSGCSSSYVFTAAGETYEGGLGDCTRPVGTNIPVYYLPADPRIRTTLTPAAQLWEDSKFILVVGVLVPSGFFWAWHSSTRPKAPSRSV